MLIYKGVFCFLKIITIKQILSFSLKTSQPKLVFFLLQVLILGQTLENRSMDLKRTVYCSFLPLYSLSTSPLLALAMSSFSPNHLETTIDY